MKHAAWSWAYWALFGAGLSCGMALVVVLFLRLNASFAQAQLTRSTLVDSLVLAFGALAMLLIAGWAYASRPQPRQPRHDDDRHVFS